MDVLLRIPVLGVVIQFVGYLIEVPSEPSPRSSSASPTPSPSGRCAAIMNERSGVVNIGIEGMMLIGRVRRLLRRRLRRQAGARRTPGRSWVTRPLLLGVVAAVRSRRALSACSTPGCRSPSRADQIISGTIINIAALGLTGYLEPPPHHAEPPARRRDVPDLRTSARARRPPGRRPDLRLFLSRADRDVG